MSNVTMSQIAEYVGVSQATVSFVLNGRERKNGSISPETRQRVTDAAQKLGYRPNRSARALATGRTHLVGLCMWDLASSHYAGVIRHSESQIRDSPYHLIVSRWKTEAAETDPQSVQGIFPWPLDGVLALEAGIILKNHWETEQSWPSPLVSMGGVDYAVDNVDYVGIDLNEGLRKSIQHLVEIGCKRIAYALNPWPIESSTDLRPQVFHEVMHQLGRPAECILLTEQNREIAREQFKAYVSEHGCPDGLICINDETALGIYRALYDLGIKFPHDIALIGCDGINDTTYLEFPLTTVVQPVKEMCRIAWEMLQNRLINPDAPLQRTILIPELAIRESSKYFGGSVQNTK
jgi:DNA-binding LacI/PurR family transcriptional regulator